MTSPSPLTDADWPHEIDDLRDGFAGALNVYRLMAHHPALLRAWAICASMWCAVRSLRHSKARW